MSRSAIVDPIRHCENCGDELERKRFNGRLEDRGVFLRRRNCGQSCANSRQDVQTDSHRWRARQAHERTNCAECGIPERLHVHHVDRDPSNNAPENLVTLCASHHLKLHWREDREKRLAAMREARERARG